MNAEYKATKIQKGSKTFVVVTDARGNEVARCGGKRAERAKAVVLTVDEMSHHGEVVAHKYDAGCRQGVGAAAIDARSGQRASGRFFKDFYYNSVWVPASVTRESYAIRID